MPEILANNYQSLGTMNQRPAGSLTKFHPIVAGNTLGAHFALIRKLEAIGQTQVISADKCDYFLVFCPIVSRVGTDISEALERIPDGRGAILVVMHHTINPDGFVGDSSRHANRPDIILTVDCVFYEDNFPRCIRNEEAFNDIKSLVGVRLSTSRRRWIIWATLILLLFIILVVVLCLTLE